MLGKDEASVFEIKPGVSRRLSKGAKLLPLCPSSPGPPTLLTTFFSCATGHEVVFFFALGRKAQYCSQCTKDELQQYNSGDSGETRAWSSGLVEEGRQQYHGPREAWDKMMAEAEKVHNCVQIP